MWPLASEPMRGATPSEASCASLADNLTARWRSLRTPLAPASVASRASRATALTARGAGGLAQELGAAARAASLVSSARGAASDAGATSVASAAAQREPRAPSAPGGASSAAARARPPQPPASAPPEPPAGDVARFPPAGRAFPERTRNVRLFDNSPGQQSLVDQVVFGRDVDQSGESQIDPEFITMFDGSAGRGSWTISEKDKAFDTLVRTRGAAAATLAHPRRPEGKRVYPNARFQQAAVEQVIFGRDADRTAEEPADKEFNSLFDNSAGRASWVNSSSGIRTFGTGPGQTPPHDFPPMRHFNTLCRGRGKRACRGGPRLVPRSGSPGTPPHCRNQDSAAAAAQQPQPMSAR